MIRNIIVLFSLLFFTACSFKSPPNQWEYKSAAAFNSYKSNFFEDNILLAKDDLKRAIKYAKQSADLKQLGRIYLGVCALNKSIGKGDKCSGYEEIKDLIASKELDAYYNLLQDNLSASGIGDLPEIYRSFVEYRSKKEYGKAFEAVHSMDRVSSKFVSAALMKDELKKAQVDYLIKSASFYGYKRIVLYWLEIRAEKELDLEKKGKILKRIEVLKN